MSRYAFGPFILDPQARVLLREGEPVAMPGKILDTLVVLVQNRGRVVDKDELLSRIWPGIVVEEANLTQSIFTVRKILGDSPKDHRYIATVAGRGYQFVAPVTELVNPTPPTAGTLREAPQQAGPRSIPIVSLIKQHRKIAMAVCGVAGALVGIGWPIARRPAAPSELVERRLTFNSSASTIASAAISPDGKYLAYSDPTGIQVRLISAGEERLIPTPSVVPASALSYVDSWFPDGTELLGHSREADGHGSMWTISVMGQSPRELRGDAWGWEVSPDGRRIAFSPSRAVYEMREIWVMDSQGGNAQKILELGPNEFLWRVHWSPDGRRLVYVKVGNDGQRTETCDLNGANRTDLVVASNSDRVQDISWLPDNRIIYSRRESPGLQNTNLWQIGVNPHSGTPIGRPKRITHWTGANLYGLSASADGKRLILRKVIFRAQVYLGELAAGGTRLSPPRRLTNDEANDPPTAWTADSKAVLFMSDRNGKWAIFKQGINQDAAEAVVAGRESVDLPRLSADGKWILYMETTPATTGRSPLYRLMRVPVDGGLPRPVFETTQNWEYYLCGKGPTRLCVFLEYIPYKNQMALTAFDPLKGRGKLLRVMETGPLPYSFGEGLSPDGSTFAIARHFEPKIHIRLLSLSGGPDREIVVKDWPNITGLDWSADGRGLYCGSSSPQGGTLLYIDLNGTAHVLWKSTEAGGDALLGGVPSPDGRYLAIWSTGENSNIWMVEGF
jgi:DNA-binding winged helix-turn-helix (wHTH) protein/Tol biopolymer transport system component